MGKCERCDEVGCHTYFDGYAQRTVRVPHDDVDFPNWGVWILPAAVALIGGCTGLLAHLYQGVG